MLFVWASCSTCSRSSSYKRIVKFFLGSIDCPLLPISIPSFYLISLSAISKSSFASNSKPVRREFARYVKRHAFHNPVRGCCTRVQKISDVTAPSSKKSSFFIEIREVLPVVFLDGRTFPGPVTRQGLSLLTGLFLCAFL